MTLQQFAALLFIGPIWVLGLGLIAGWISLMAKDHLPLPVVLACGLAFASMLTGFCLGCYLSS